MQALDNGALIVSMKINSVEDARAAVAATYYPPRGVREPSRAKRHKSLPEARYLEWYNDQILVSLQLESPGALENYREIVKVDGADIIQFGKHGFAAALGISMDLAGYGPTMDPRLEDYEKRVVFAALEAGKQVSLVHSLTPEGIERTLRWIEQGVYVMCMDSDWIILNRDYSNALKALRQSTAEDSSQT
jgi:2-keto-3-deoxy-L-rhamnonate aldolase RhmA